MKTTQVTNTLLAVIALCLVWLCLSPALPTAQAQSGTVQRVVIVGSGVYEYGEFKSVPLPVAIRGLADGSLPVNIRNSPTLPVRLVGTTTSDNYVPVTIKGIVVKDGALPVRVEHEPATQK